MRESEKKYIDKKSCQGGLINCTIFGRILYDHCLNNKNFTKMTGIYNKRKYYKRKEDVEENEDDDNYEEDDEENEDNEEEEDNEDNDEEKEKEKDKNISNKIKNINLKKIKFTHSDLLSQPKKNYISRNTSLFRIYNGNLKKKYKNISLNSSFFVNCNFEKKCQLKKCLSQKIMTKETKFSSKEHSFLNKEQINKSSKNTNRNHSDNIYELQKTIGKPILRNKFNIQINLFKNKKFLNSYCTGSYNIPLVSNLV